MYVLVEDSHKSMRLCVLRIHTLLCEYFRREFTHYYADMLERIHTLSSRCVKTRMMFLLGEKVV